MNASRDQIATPHTQRGIEQANDDAAGYRINGKTLAERRGEDEEQRRLKRIAAMMDGRLA